MADDLLLVDAADGGVAGVNGDLAVVAHDEDLALGHLVGKLDVSLTVGLGFVEVGLIDPLLVHVDISLLVQVDPLAAPRDDALDEDVVIVVKGHDLAGVHGIALDGEHDVAVVQGPVHGLSVDVQDRQEEDGDQDRHGGHRDQAENRAPHGRKEAGPVVFFFQLLLQKLAGGEFHRGRRIRVIPVLCLA